MPPTPASRCRCECDAVSWRPGNSRSLPRGAPLPTKTASNRSPSSLPSSTPASCSGYRHPYRGCSRFLRQHVLGQTEGRDVGSHQTAGLILLLEDGDLVAKRHQVVRHRKRGRTRADAGDALAVLLLRARRQQMLDFVAKVGSNALQPADSDGFTVKAAAAAGGFTRTIASSAENAGKTFDSRLSR